VGLRIPASRLAETVLQLRAQGVKLHLLVAVISDVFEKSTSKITDARPCLAGVRKVIKEHKRAGTKCQLQASIE
jgi:hypothetical protein